MKSLPNKELLRPDEVSNYFRVSVSAVYSWVNEGKLEAIRLPGKTIRIKRTVIEDIQNEPFE